MRRISVADTSSPGGLPDVVGDARWTVHPRGSVAGVGGQDRRHRPSNLPACDDGRSSGRSRSRAPSASPMPRAGLCPTRRRSAPPSAPSTSPVPGFASANVEYVASIPVDNPGVERPGRRRRRAAPPLRQQHPGPVDLRHQRPGAAAAARPPARSRTGRTRTSPCRPTGRPCSSPSTPAPSTCTCSTPRTRPCRSGRASLLLDSGGHTSECLDPACDWVYGSEGQIIDLRDKANPVVQEERWTDLLGLPDGHAMTLDEAGVLTIDTTPLAMVDASDPLHPVLLATAPEGAQDEAQTAYQHNNLRPHAGRVPQPQPALDAPARAGRAHPGQRRDEPHRAPATRAPGRSPRGAPAATTAARLAPGARRVPPGQRLVDRRQPRRQRPRVLGALVHLAGRRRRRRLPRRRRLVRARHEVPARRRAHRRHRGGRVLAAGLRLGVGGVLGRRRLRLRRRLRPRHRHPALRRVRPAAERRGHRGVVAGPRRATSTRVAAAERSFCLIGQQ